jgi:type II secretory pathway component GspD/PulD (secretin)
MPRNFSLLSNPKWRSPQFVVRAILGVLLAANLVAAGLVLFPVGGSAEDLDRQLASLMSQVITKKALLERTKQHAEAVQRGRSEGDQFVDEYFLANRTASSTVLRDLVSAASQAKIQQREQAYTQEPIEGSDTLSMMSITAAYEGTYAELLRFVHEIDKSPRLLIIESLTASPLQGSDKLTVSMKLDTLVRDDGAGTQ